MGEPAQEVLARTELAQQQSELALARSEHAEERAKLERERAELELSRSFATRHAGVLITAIASVMAVAVTSIVSYNQRRTQIDTEDIRKDREIEISSEGHERQWKLALLNYMTDNLDKILAIGSEKPNPILEMISATFEEKYTAPLFQGLEATADSDKKGRWRRAQGYVFQKSEASPDPPPLENQEVEAFLEKPRETFNGPNRRRARNAIAAEATNDSGIHERIVDTLIASIIDSEGPQTYRVNLYIASTLSRIKPKWRGIETQRKTFDALTRSTSYADPTFKKTVNKALDNFAAR